MDHHTTGNAYDINIYCSYSCQTDTGGNAIYGGRPKTFVQNKYIRLLLVGVVACRLNPILTDTLQFKLAITHLDKNCLNFIIRRYIPVYDKRK